MLHLEGARQEISRSFGVTFLVLVFSFVGLLIFHVLLHFEWKMRPTREDHQENEENAKIEKRTTKLTTRLVTAFLSLLAFLRLLCHLLLISNTVSSHILFAIS